VPSTLAIEAARIPDRDRLLRELRAAGLEAAPIDEVGIEVPADQPGATSDELYESAERLVLSIGAPFVPIRHRGVVYIRPPLS
jgi:hypothetical protein